MYQSCNGFRLELRKVSGESGTPAGESMTVETAGTISAGAAGTGGESAGVPVAGIEAVGNVLAEGRMSSPAGHLVESDEGGKAGAGFAIRSEAVPVQGGIEINPGSAPFEFYPGGGQLFQPGDENGEVPEYVELEVNDEAESSGAWNGEEEITVRSRTPGNTPNGTPGNSDRETPGNIDNPPQTQNPMSEVLDGNDINMGGGVPPLSTPLIPSIFPENPTFSVPANPLLPPAYQELLSYDALQYMNGFLRTQVGRVCQVDFLMGTNQMVTKRGRLLGVGLNYILLIPHDELSMVLACDFYSIKFICFEEVYSGEGPQGPAARSIRPVGETVRPATE